MKKKFIFLFVIAFILSGCKKEKVEPSEKIEETKKIKIGMIFDTFVVERWERDRDVFVSRATELGAEVNIQNAHGSIEEQINNMNYFIDKKFDVIIVVPIGSDSLAPSIKKAHDAGIKVISYDRLLTKSNSDLFISFNNEEVGKEMGKSVAKELEIGDKVMMVCGPKTDNNIFSIEKGFKEEIEKKDIIVEDITYIENWKAELAYTYINNNIDKVKNVKAIMCGNDNLAGEVYKALSERRLADSILIVGQDADLEACQRIVEGTQLITVYKPVEKLARLAAESAVKLAKGEAIEYTKKINDGIYSVPFIELEPITVNKNNINATIIDSGFHLKEDVYLNRPALVE